MSREASTRAEPCATWAGMLRVPARRRAAWVLLAGLALAPITLGADAVEASEPAAKPARTLRLLYFHASWCHGCRRFEQGRVLERLQAQRADVAVQKVDVEAEPALRDKYGVELTPTVLLVDARGERLGKLRITLAEPDATLQRALALLQEHTR